MMNRMRTMRMRTRKVRKEKTIRRQATKTMRTKEEKERMKTRTRTKKKRPAQMQDRQIHEQPKRDGAAVGLLRLLQPEHELLETSQMPVLRKT
jgi:hypothetical protein